VSYANVTVGVAIWRGGCESAGSIVGRIDVLCLLVRFWILDLLQTTSWSLRSLTLNDPSRSDLRVGVL